MWDDAFAAVHTSDPLENDLIDTQIKINTAMVKIRELKMNITSKAHGMEDHVVDQMIITPGSIVRMIEHWVERYHQVGYIYNDKWRRAKGEIQKAELQAHREHIGGNTEVKKQPDALQKYLAKGKHESTVERGEDTKKVKKERREDVSPKSAGQMALMEEEATLLLNL